MHERYSMKTLSIKKILLITLIFALFVGLGAALGHGNAYAAVNPDEIVAYEEGSEGGLNRPDEGQIAPPRPNPDDNKDYDVDIHEIVVQFGKLRVGITGWSTPVTPSSRPLFNANPDGKYDPKLVEKINNLIDNGALFDFTQVFDAEGNPVADVNALPEGSTYFIHVIVKDLYKNDVEVVFADGIPRSLSGSIGFADGKVTAVKKFEKTTFEVQFDGKSININDEVLTALLKDRDYLTLVESESDSITPTAAGEYHYRLIFKTTARYCWENPAAKNDRSAVDIVVKVKPMELPTEVDFGEIYYTGAEIDVAEKIKEVYKDYVQIAVGYDTKGTDAGEYSVKLLIKDEYFDSIKWKSDEEIDSVTLKWNILQTTIKGEWDTYGSLGRINIISDTYVGGTEKAIKYTYIDKATNAEVTKLEVGHTYIVKVELVSDKNLKWSDDTATEHEFTLERELVQLKKPVVDVEAKEFSGAPITFKITIDSIDISDAQFAEHIEIVTGSDELTQTNVGDYKVTIRLKNDASWEGYFTDDAVITFSIVPLELDVAWNDPDAGTPTFSSNYLNSDYSTIVKVTYTDVAGAEVRKSQMIKGNSYTATVTLIDENNFKWKDGATLSYTFTMNLDFRTLEKPVLSTSTFDYTSGTIDILASLADRATLEGYMESEIVEVVKGSFEETHAGTYEVVLKIVDSGCVWKDNPDEYVTLTFTINKAVLTGEWGTDGKVKFTSSFTGKYDDVVEYEYTDADGNVVNYSDLVEGETYTAKVKLKEGQERDFDDSKLPSAYEFTFTSSEEESSFPWWIFLIIGAVLIIIIIIIIIIVLKKRRKDDDYDDFYDDEYYGDDSDGSDGYGSDDYGSDDYGSDDYGDDY